MKRDKLMARLVWLLAITIGIALAPQTARAVDGKEIVAGGGEISFTGATEKSWVANPDGSQDLLLIFSDPETKGSFTFPGVTQARILTVGGGGGGGGSFRTATSGGNYGGGGGGGGGAVVETNDLFAAGTYDVQVGLGGEGGIISAKRPTALDFSGEDGGETSISIDETVFMTAAGGGGGGAESDGHPGGSGGGGSKLWNSSGGVNKAGGAGSRGGAGGAGDAGNYGGGGGGAGGAGSAAATKDPKGGLGVSSDITGTVAWYAGGGGGGNNNKSATAGTAGAAGGSGVGGVGGVGSGIVAPGVGQPGTGGGGGGASYNAAGGAGGSGVVCVRISGAVAGGLSKPTDKVFKYDGKAHTAYESSPFYTVDGTSTATEIGVYTVTVTPRPGIKWEDDGSDAAVTVTMTIYEPSAKSGTELVTGTPVDYFGAAEVSRVGDDLLLKFTGAGSFTLPGTARARILAVGGGGGGGGSFRTATSGGNYGGGGGGGAGAFVETNGMVSAGVYRVSVGSGGVGGIISAKRPTALDFSGEDGERTLILKGAETWVAADGGGGGGAESDGHPGGSGGGGSKLWNSSGGVNKAGGAGSRGGAGGAGDAGNYGGGGGGAGGPGDAASTKNPKGGAGVSSDITGATAWYAGGGGGGNNNKSATAGTAGAPGGSGVGGVGGVGSGIVAPGAGQPGTGGGGGGASYNAAGGAGGSGVVYVRISAAMSGELKKPEKIQDLTFDGNAHTSVVASVFYEISGQTIGTDAGTYEATVTLKDGFSWPGGDLESPVNVRMTISPCTVTISDFKLADWVYTTRAEDIPDPTYAIEPAWVKPQIEYAESETAPEGEWSTEKIVVAGAHWVRARLADTKNFIANSAKASYAVSPAAVTFKDLFQKDWMEGTPDEETPPPRCTVTPSWVVPKYQYAATEDAPETDWSDTKPTALGTWAIRVIAPDQENYTYTPATASFAIVKGRGGTFVDYVDITIDGYAGTNPSVLSNYVYKITLSEERLPGFLYSRAGEDGDEMGFTDAKGNDLKYRVGDWNKYGESVVYVQIPEIGKEPQTIRLYWCLRTGATAPEHDPASVVPGEEKAIGYTTDLVVRKGYRVNYWKTYPTMTKVIWAQGQAAGRLKAGTLADGKYDSKIVNAVTGETLASMPTKGGAYRYVFALVDPNLEYEQPFEYHIDFAITSSSPMDDLAGAVGDLTVNGRVMIANDDAAPGYAVTGQSYWHVDPATEPVWWEHGGEHSALSAYPNLRKFPGNTHRLNCLDGEGRTNLLWRMNEVILGNTFNNAALEGVKCFFPWSPTGLGMSGDGVAPGTRDEAGWMVMRNTTSAVIYSPCYTNGIGTIYFDAVNVYGIDNSLDPENYAIEVDIATNVYGAVDLPPTDANCRGLNEFDVEDEFGRLRESCWTTVKMIPLKRDNDAKDFMRLPETDHLALDIVKCQSTNNFYRVCVQLDITRPVRFRIRRAGAMTKENVDIRTGYLALDNILVSYPKSTANLRPHGTFDAGKGGKRVIGQEGAFSVPFLAVDEGEVYGGATNDLYVSDACAADPREFVLLSRLHYRWRYADQEAKAWQTLDMSPFDGYRTVDPLKLEHEDGDLEFWYESFLNIPFYAYHDYSGAGVGLGGLYTEEVTTVTNRIDLTRYSTFSGPGEDWFIRFRAGKSDWDELTVTVTGAYKDEQAMELVGDHTWRGLVRVPSNATGAVTFYFSGNARYGAWGRRLESGRTWYPAADVVKMPSRGETVDFVSADPAKWHTYRADGASGYVEFQFNDETGAFTIGHAEYQTFNAWHDAKREDGKFVGNWSETSGVNVASMVQTNAPMRTWSLHAVSNANWNETFELPNYLDTGYPKYTATPFVTHKMPHLWNGENGYFVDASLTKSNVTDKGKSSGLAWQMQGKGLGSVSYTAKDVPSGLDTVKFQARLAQGIGFNDFSVWSGDGSTSAKDYTFVFPAVLSAANGNDCAPGASMSVVGYYVPWLGCYEFRVERVGSDGMMFSIYKWRSDDDEIVPECIATQWFKDTVFIQNNAKPSMYAMFISVGGEADNATTVIAGLAKAAAQPNATFSGVDYRAICAVDDTDTRLTGGAFGALCSNCNGLFMSPRHYASFLPQAKVTWKTPVGSPYGLYKGYSDAAKVTFVGTQTDDSRLLEPERISWKFTPSRAEYREISYGSGSTSFLGKGIALPANLSQTVGVYLKPAEGGSWALYDERTVSSYGFKDFSVEVKTNADCHVMLKAGSRKTDVTVWKIEQTAWNGQDVANIDGKSRDFAYTQARIVSGDVVDLGGGNKATNRYAVLQPSRTVPTQPLSIRSPLLKGLGMVGFSYKDVCEGSEIWVQVATNEVSANLGGSLGYNQSVRSVDDGEPEAIGEWVTLRRYGYDELKGASEQKFYIGWHDRPDAPLQGVIRLFVPTNVAAAAVAAVGADKKRADWGSITVTDVYVHDEPAIDTRSWMGWNLRMVGDPTDSEKRMYLPDMTVANAGGEVGSGLSMALNNSVTADIAGDPSEYDKNNPFVQSPTFGMYATSNGTAQATIGQVRFRARLYDENAVSARVALYGVKNGVTTDWGQPITNFTVTSKRYSIFEFKASSRENFAAVRLVVDGVKEGVFGVKRVLLDEIVVSEKNDVAIGVHYLRPFRTGIENDLVVENILDKDQQPLSGESWGVQTKLKFDLFGNEVDVDRGFKVTFRYFVGDTPWGYRNWADDPAASKEVALKQVGSKNDFVFRSTSLDRETVVPPQAAGSAIVQYAVTVYYYEKGNGTLYDQTVEVGEVEGDGWTNPTWYWPMDYNREGNRADGAMKTDTTPYTILESVSPGRAWINEVNYNDGTLTERGQKVVSNQFVEVAVPWGVDLTDWTLRVTDFNHRTATLAVLGRNGIPGVKKTDDGRRSGDYDFLVLESPATRTAGGIRDAVTGKPAADGVWTSQTLNGTLTQGTLQYDLPYQLELVRPSGIVEHQFVVAGTNEYRYSPVYEYFGYQQDGTNLVNELDYETPSALRFFAGEDLSRLTAAPDRYASLGVVGRAHGEQGGWSGEMGFTPGRVNEGQEELSGWYIRPSGGSCWVYLRATPPYLSQDVGGDKSPDTFVIVNEGEATNVVYTAAPWYQVDKIHRIENGVTNTTVAAKEGQYVYEVNGVTGTTTIVATWAVSQKLVDLGLDPADRYTPAIMRWLEAGKADGKDFKHPGEIRLATYRGLSAGSTNCTIGIKGMYWFDIDPTEGGWWLRGDTTDIKSPVPRKWYQSDGSYTPYDNVQVKVKLYLSNDTDRAVAEVYAPKRLQGVNGERSDDPATYSNWTSVTFKVEGNLLNGLAHNAGYLPFRWFVFGPGSFDANYETTIELMDPFSPASPGYTYGWSDYTGTGTGFRWNINEKLQPFGVDMLKADSTYEGRPPFVKP